MEVSSTLNGAPYTPGTIIHEPNHYTLIVDVRDASGNSKQVQVNFSRSSTTAEALNGEFTSGLSGWNLTGDHDLISITDTTSMDPGGYAATIDPPAPSESAGMHSDLIYVLADSIVDLSLYLYGRAQDEMALQVIGYADNTKQNPIPLITDEKIYPTVDYTWQRIATQLIIPQDQYFIEVILGRNDQTLSTEALAMDSISLLPISFIASTFYHNNLWITIDDGTRNLLSGAQEDLGIFDDPILSTVSNLPNSTCGKKTLRLKNKQILRDVYLTSGAYTPSFDVWSGQSLDFTVDIGLETYTLTALPQGDRHIIIHTVTQDGWCSIDFTNSSNKPIYITQVQMEQGTMATSHTPAGRSPGYLRIDLDEEERIDFAQQGQLSFAFSPGKQGEDLFLAGEGQWGIAYKSQTQNISFSMADMPDICYVDLSPDGIEPPEYYHVLLSWDGAKISLEVSRYPTMEALGYAESSEYNTQITSGAFWVGSRLKGTNQSQPSSGIYGAIHFQTNTASGCVQFEETCAGGYHGNYVILGDADADNVTICQGDCDDSDPNVYQGAEELCDGKDNDCDGLNNEEDAKGCTIYYKDKDEDGYGVDDDSRCLCSQDPNTKYTATQGGDWNDTDPDITGNFVNVDLSLLEGWIMISLPVTPYESKVTKLFPEAVVVYCYKKGEGYKRVKEDEELKRGKGYWILFNNDQNLTINGKPIYSYTHTVYEKGWEMIGGCFSKALTSGNKCDIGVIYGYVRGMGYQRVPESEYLEPGNGYWILLENVTDQAKLNVQVLME